MKEASVRFSGPFLVATAFFITALITSNIIAVKLAQIGPFVLPAAIILFPVSYILGDVLTEVYGYRAARRVIWLGFACNALVVLFVWLGGLLPGAPFWEAQPAYQRILGFTPRLLAASFTAYLLGEFANAMVLARLKVATRGRWLWLRTIGSTLVGQGLDSLVFITLAFGFNPGIVVTQWLAKSAYEAVATPLTYAVVTYLKRVEGVDADDRYTDLNPIQVLG